MPHRSPVLPLLLPLALSLLACDAANGERAARAPNTAAEDDAPVCEMAHRPAGLPDGLHEASGVAVSRRTPGVLWLHEDSGGDAELFAVGTDGRDLGRVEVRGAENNDWEDVAVGPCEGGTAGSCLYVADVGDNGADRRDVEVWMVPEPAPGDARTAEAVRFRARYPGGPRDAEALFVLPDGGVYVVSKGEDGPVEVFRFPLVPGDRGAEMERVRSLGPEPSQPGDRITAADASPDGRWVALRTYRSLFLVPTDELLRPSGPLSLRSADLTGLGEAQGEGVALAGDGTVWLASEGAGRGAPGTLAALRCRLE